MHIVEVSSKYRYTVVEILGFGWADRPGLVFMVQSNTCVSLKDFIWMSYRDVMLYLKVSAKNLTISGLSMIDVAFNCNSPLPKTLSGFTLWRSRNNGIIYLNWFVEKVRWSYPLCPRSSRHPSPRVSRTALPKRDIPSGNCACSRIPSWTSHWNCPTNGRGWTPRYRSLG